MEMMHLNRSRMLQVLCLCFGILLQVAAFAQPVLKKYSIKKGNETIELSKHIPEKELDDFVRAYDLGELDLKTFIKTGSPDSLAKLGWIILANTSEVVVLTKPMFSHDLLDILLEKVHFDKSPFAENNSNVAAIRYGYNQFKDKRSFEVRDSVVVFFLKNHKKAGEVLLAADFTNWQAGAVRMTQTDSGWVAAVKPGEGKHWYKFIVDGEWITDPRNQLSENDADGNTNSVYYKPNHRFTLNGFINAKKVYLAGSFNEWREKELLMQRTHDGWELPMLLPKGTHTYKFIVDGRWLTDDANPDKLPDGHGAYNSVLRFGSAHTFRLDGYMNAKAVMLAGSFNGWKEDELLMQKTSTGWELPYVIGPGNYEYKFIVDKKWIPDPVNTARGNDGNSFLVIEPNYTFSLHAPNAKKVMVAGDFNGWNPASAPMTREGNTWVFKLHLAPGKHRYKFIVDGEWIRDPANKLWEENEFGTGNSVVWIEN